jgi:carbamoyltransferase
LKNSSFVLGLNFGGHDTSAAIMKDGVLVAGCEQERYTRDKHSRKFPKEAVDDCLHLAGVKMEDISEIAFAFSPQHHVRETYLRPALCDDNRLEFLVNDIDRIKDVLNSENTIRSTLGFNGKVGFYRHHECHLASTLYPSGFKDALVVSYDGIGEIESGILAVAKKGDLRIFHETTHYPDSLGLLYSAVTAYLGWRHHSDEGIVMGLACYGDAQEKCELDPKGRSYLEVFNEIIREISDYDYRINRDWISYHKVRDKWVSEEFVSVLGPRRTPNGAVTSRHKDIAAALQSRVSTVILNQLRRARDQFNVKHLCLSGGVALNCSINGDIERSKLFDEIFVQPASGDAGVAIGACYLAHKAQKPEYMPKKMHNFYLGSKFQNQEIEKAFSKRNLEAVQPDDLLSRTAARLSEGRIVGWFQGGAEFGPRALGNRSILTRPFPADMKDYLNMRVKFREEFRPFAPAVLIDYFSEYFEIGQESPHMLIACQATEKARQEIPATVHVDGTCRVQTVRKDNNPRFFSLLEAFFSHTGYPVLLNTSFNVKGQPIVNTPGQAIDCYLSTDIDCLVVGEFLIEKDSH